MKVHSRLVLAAWMALTSSAMTHAANSAATHEATSWTEGKHYFLVNPPRIPSVAPGKVEVTEVFSYGCPACNLFVPVMHKLKQTLPANAVLTYLPASFNPSEDWPMFQLAFCTAQALGVAEQTNDAMFDAVWKTGELAVIDPVTQRIKDRLPTLEDAARFYNRTAGVPIDKFLSTAKSFAVDTKVRSAEDAIQAYRVDRTPTIIVNGKYRLHVQSAGGNDELIELVKWLVAKETK
ncbi:MAG TPA: thiol:disulfide interchange protein DsbA/DsbL [Steroidobacteraceae bacterium]